MIKKDYRGWVEIAGDGRVSERLRGSRPGGLGRSEGFLRDVDAHVLVNIGEPG